MENQLNNKKSKILYTIIFVLLIAVVFQTLIVVKYHKTIYNNNVLSYNRASLEMIFMTDNLRTPDIYSKDKEQITMSEKEIVDIYNELINTQTNIRYVKSMVIPTNEKSKYIKQIISKLDFSLNNLSYQFLNNKDITYSDARRLIDQLIALEHSMEAPSTTGAETNLALTETQMEDILKNLDKLAKFNVLD